MTTEPKPHDVSELVEAALRTAYEQGCIDTHNAIQSEPELALMAVESAGFGEAAYDYAAQALADFQRGKES